MSSTNKNYDDLTAIKGIGAIRQQWFNEVFDVYTFEALAALRIDDVEAQLRADGRVASRTDIMAWLEQAEKLSQNERPPSAESTKSETAVASSISSIENSWKPFASFVVEYQTRTSDDREEYRTTVHHMETDIGTTWPDIKSDELCQWLTTRLGERANTAKQIVETRPVDLPATTIAITQVRAFQPRQAPLPSTSSRPIPAILKSNESFDLEVEVTFSAEDEAAISSRDATCSGQLQVYNLSNGKRSHIEMASNPIQPHQQCSIMRLLNVSLEPGVYKLGVLAKLENAALATDYLELPLVQLV